jgi:hypothetical protein
MNGNLYVEQVQPRRVVVDNIGALTSGGAETLATRMDTASATGITYVGKAQPGTSTASALWQIQKLDETGTPETLVITYADGNAEFDNVWSDRLSLSYS